MIINKGRFLLALIILFLITSIPCFAAKNYRIEIKMLPMSIQDDRFYVNQVIDGRIDKRSVGTAQVGIFNSKVPAELSGDFSTTIQSFLNVTFNVDDKKTPITIVVEDLRVSESEEFSGEYGRVEAKIKFYKSSGNKLGKLFEVVDFAEKRSFMDVSKYHEENIRNVIEKCFVSFINSGWDKVEVEWIDISEFEEV